MCTQVWSKAFDLGPQSLTGRSRPRLDDVLVSLQQADRGCCVFDAGFDGRQAHHG